MKACIIQPYYSFEHANGIRCNVFWADDPQEACRYIDMGIDTILTNDYLQVSNAVKQTRILNV